MAIELSYKKLIAKHKIEVAKLPEDAQNGIQMIEEIMNGIRMLEAKNMAPKDKTIKRIKSMDKWVYNEILDHINDTEENEEEMPDEELEEEIEEIDEQLKKKKETQPATPKKAAAPAAKVPATPPAKTDDGDGNKKTADEELGIAINTELEELMKSEKREYSLEELKSAAKKTYTLIFDTYEQGAENGVQTTQYSLLETTENVFTLKQK